MNANDISALRVSDLDSIVTHVAVDPMVELRGFAAAVADLLAINFRGLKIESDETLLNNPEAFGYLFGLVEQSQRFFVAQSNSSLADELAKRVLAVILNDVDRASALITYVEFQRKNVDFAEGYVQGMRAAVRMARA